MCICQYKHVLIRCWVWVSHRPLTGYPLPWQLFVFVAAEYSTPETAFNQVCQNHCWFFHCAWRIIDFASKPENVSESIGFWSLQSGLYWQVSLWDTIIERKEDTKIQEEVIAKLIRRMKRDGPFTYPFQVSLHCARISWLQMSWIAFTPYLVYLMNNIVWENSLVQ